MIAIPAVLLLALSVANSLVCFLGGALTTAFVYWINHRKSAS